MKLLLLLIFFPLATFGQYPLITDNWDFQKKQQDKMRQLGYQKVNVKLTRKYTGSGKIFETEETWQSFDSLGRFTKRGFKNNGTDTLVREFYYSITGKSLGYANFYNENREGRGRELVYDLNDSLIEERYRDGRVNHKYEYSILNDSTVLVTEYNDPLAQGLKYLCSKKVVRSQNVIIIYVIKGEEIVAEQKYEFDEYGRLKFLVEKSTWGISKEFYQYNEEGKLITREWHNGQDNSDLYVKKMVWTYNSNNDLIKYELFERGKLKEMDEYQFEGSLLIKQVSTKYFAGWEEGYTYYFKYYENGLILSCTHYFGAPHNITDTHKFTYD